MVFSDRKEAGRLLAEKLAPIISHPSVVAAIPRGGVTVALPIVERFKLPLTVVYARKLTAPFAPELAFGALDEDGQTVIDANTVAGLELSQADLEKAKETVGAEIRRRMALYRVPPLRDYLPGAAVVLVDDGLATGLTMRAALLYARRHGAREIIVAVPCASLEAAERFRREADRFVSLVVDEEFAAVGEYYLDFSPVTDEEVVTMLAGSQDRGSLAISEDPGLLVRFENSRGLALAGRLLVPDSPGPHPVALFAHGRGSDKASPRNLAVAEALLREGFAAFLFDFTGHGESEGREDESTLPRQAEDLRTALDLLERLDEIDPESIAVVGASSGAATALVTAAADPRIRVLVLLSGNPEGAEDAAPKVIVPTLLVVGELDEPIRALNEKLVVCLAGPKRLEVAAGGDHLFAEPAALRRAIDLTVRWLNDHLKRGRSRSA